MIRSQKKRDDDTQRRAARTEYWVQEHPLNNSQWRQRGRYSADYDIQTAYERAMAKARDLKQKKPYGRFRVLKVVRCLEM